MALAPALAILLLGLPEPASAGEAAALQIVPRAEWDPAPRQAGTRYRGRLKELLTTIVVHHSDFLEPPGPLGIKQYHLEVSGFSDIGYHFVIAPDGTVYEGRPLDRMGAHAGVTREAARGDKAKDPDWGAIGIVLDGYFGEELPPEPQRAALLRLIDELRARFPRIERVIGHREVRRELVLGKKLTAVGEPTVCPGDALFLWLDAQRREHRFRGPPVELRAQGLPGSQRAMGTRSAGLKPRAR